MKDEPLIQNDLKKISAALQSISASVSIEDFMLNKSLILPVAVNRRKKVSMLYRVFFNASNASYARCFTDKEEAEKFYNGLLHADCYTNVVFQEG